MYQGASPAHAVIAALTDEGNRTWAMTQDQDDMVAMTRTELIGRTVEIDEHRYARFPNNL